MDAFGVAVEGQGRGAQEMHKTGAADPLQHRIDRHLGAEHDRFGGGHFIGPGPECKLVAALRLAAQFEADRCCRQQIEGEIAQRSRFALFELEFDFGDRFAALVGGANDAAIDRGLDARARDRRDFDGQPLDLGHKQRP